MLSLNLFVKDIYEKSGQNTPIFYCYLKQEND